MMDMFPASLWPPRVLRWARAPIRRTPFSGRTYHRSPSSGCPRILNQVTSRNIRCESDGSVARIYQRINAIKNNAVAVTAASVWVGG